jgi:hypothetical protein
MKKILLFSFISFISFLLINSTNVFANVFHTETPPALFPLPTKEDIPTNIPKDDYDLLVRFVPAGPQASALIGINIYTKISATTRGYQLINDDDVCVGDKIEFSQTMTGEWFGKGGNSDSPPIKWKEGSLSFASLPLNKGGGINGGKLCYYGGGSWCNYFDVSCSQNCQTSGNILNGMTVSQEGNLSFDLNCPISCEYSGYAAPGFLTWKYDIKKKFGPTALTSFNIKEAFTLNAVSYSKGPDLVVEKVFKPLDQSSEDVNSIRVIVQNKGDMKALLSEAVLNIPGNNSLYKPNSINPGETSEIIMKTSQTDNLQLTLNYKSDKLGCLKSKDFSKTIDLSTLLEMGEKTTTTTIKPACTTEGDCNTGFICCQAQCRDPNTGICRDVNGDGIPDWIPVTS